MNILLIDYSTLAGRVWFGMRNKGYIARTNFEHAEFARGLASAAAVIRARFPDYFILVCADSKSWRHGFWKDAYLKEAFEKSCSVDDTLYAYKDGEYYRMTFFVSTGLFGDPVKLKKGERLEATDHFLWSPGSIDERFHSRLKEFTGSYKGSRLDSTWPFSTPKDVYKQWREKSAPRFAGLLDAGYLKVEGAEADDLVAYCVRNAPEGSRVVVMSTDQDIAWSETKGYGQLMDTAWSCMSYDTPLRKPVEKGIVLDNLTRKVLTGDPGDDIGPCLTPEGKRVTPKAVDSLIGEIKRGNFPVDEASWDRNYTLISLRDEGPLDLEIKESLSNPFSGVETTASDWGMTDTDWQTASSEGRNYARRDSQPESWL